ncbi:MAG: cytochrome c biogenesis protein [Thermoproteota archaeon]
MFKFIKAHGYKNIEKSNGNLKIAISTHLITTVLILPLVPFPVSRSLGEDEKKICILFFYSPTCEFCQEVDSFLETYESRYKNIDVHRLDILNYENLRLKERLEEYLKVPIDKRGIIPAVYIGGHLLIGKTEIVNNFPKIFEKVEDSPCPVDIIEEDEIQSAMPRLESLTIPAVASAAIIDSLNPCSLSTLILLLALIAASKGRRNMLYAGGLYALGVFIAYTLLGFGIFTAIQRIRGFSLIVGKLIYPVTSAATFILGTLNLLDYYRIRREIEFSSLIIKTPHSLKDRIEIVLRNLAESRSIIFLSPAVGFIVSFLEFMCTGQVYLPTIVYIYGIPQLRERAATYLLIYNVIYIVPLLFVIILSYLTASFSYFNVMRRLIPKIGTIKLLTAILFP